MIELDRTAKPAAFAARRQWWQCRRRALKLRPALKSARQHVKCAPSLRRNGGCNAKASFRFSGRHSLGLCDDVRGTGRGSRRGASKRAKCLRRLPADSPLYSRGVRMETCLPAIVSRSLFLFPSLRRLWALRRGGVLGCVYGHRMGPALIA
jgi:hypothetical protein